MRVAIFGAAGQLGRELVREFSDVHEVTALTRADCDVSDHEAVMATVFGCGPDLIVNAAAMTAVDACEKDVDTAFGINAMGPRNLAGAARLLNADLVHVSTDYVFDGASSRPYDEWDEPNPISVYGRSKLAGEREAQSLWHRVYVVRTGVVFSSKPPNFALAILDRARSGDEALAVVSDQFGSPTYAPHLAAAIRRLGVSGRYGLYHAAGAGSCSRADMARALLEAAGLDAGRIQDVTSDVMSGAYPAPRPKMAALECRAWRLAGLPALPGWREGVQALVAEVQAGAEVPPQEPPRYQPPPPPIVTAAPEPVPQPPQPPPPQPVAQEPRPEPPLEADADAPGVHIADASAEDLRGTSRPESEARPEPGGSGS